MQLTNKNKPMARYRLGQGINFKPGDREPVFNEDLKCSVYFVEYLPEVVNTLVIHCRGYTDMQGAIDFATKIYPEVEQIICRDARYGDVWVYELHRGGEWDKWEMQNLHKGVPS